MTWCGSLIRILEVQNLVVRSGSFSSEDLDMRRNSIVVKIEWGVSSRKDNSWYTREDICKGNPEHLELEISV